MEGDGSIPSQETGSFAIDTPRLGADPSMQLENNLQQTTLGAYTTTSLNAVHATVTQEETKPSLCETSTLKRNSLFQSQIDAINTIRPHM